MALSNWLWSGNWWPFFFSMKSGTFSPRPSLSYHPPTPTPSSNFLTTLNHSIFVMFLNAYCWEKPNVFSTAIRMLFTWSVCVRGWNWYLTGAFNFYQDRSTMFNAQNQHSFVLLVIQISWIHYEITHYKILEIFE